MLLRLSVAGIWHRFDRALLCGTSPQLGYAEAMWRDRFLHAFEPYLGADNFNLVDILC